MKNQKIVTVIRIFLGALLIVFGLNKFMGFMPMPPLEGAAGDFFSALSNTGYIFPLVGFIEVITGVMLVFNKFTALALLLLAPISINIISFHLFLDLGGIAPAALVTALNIFLLFANKSKYSELLKA